MDVSTVKKAPVQPVQAARQPEKTQQARSQEVQPKPPEAHKTAEPKPQPVVNTQGHTTGRLLNVTA
jgi:hypothetical protein